MATLTTSQRLRALVDDLGGVAAAARAAGVSPYTIHHWLRIGRVPSAAGAVALLEAAGFGQVEVEPVVTTVLLAGGGTVDESLEFLLGMGMVKGLLPSHTSLCRPLSIAPAAVLLQMKLPARLLGCPTDQYVPTASGWGWPPPSVPPPPAPAPPSALPRRPPPPA